MAIARTSAAGATGHLRILHGHDLREENLAGRLLAGRPGPAVGEGVGQERRRIQKGPGRVSESHRVGGFVRGGSARQAQLSAGGAARGRPCQLPYRATDLRPAGARRLEGLTNRMFASVRALLTGIVDYAGLFPPAELPLNEAIRNYARYRTAPESWMLGRFICPAARLTELSPYVEELFHDGRSLAVSALGRGGKDGAN